ncbi:MAG: magnesium chelatase subunit D [Rhodospirillales bacterium]
MREAATPSPPPPGGRDRERGSAAPPPTPWSDALAAAALLAVDPHGLGGVLVRAAPGPVRDRWVEALRAALPADAPCRKVPAAIADGNLIGGLDLAATLESGRPVAARGLLAECDGGVALIPMAERLPPGTAARIGLALDDGAVRIERDGFAALQTARFGAVALDEGADEDEAVPASIAERLAIRLDLHPISVRDATPPAATRAAVVAARARLPSVAVPDDLAAALCTAAVALGVDTIRAPLAALKLARCAAALAGRDIVDGDDAALAARLVLGPRATMIPADAEDEAEPEESEAEEPPPPEEQNQGEDRPLDDVVLEAATAAIPRGLLDRLRAEAPLRNRGARQGKAGALRAAGDRGRPVGSRRGEPRGSLRLHLVATLRAAAPWQRLRRQGAEDGRIAVRRDDFRVVRLKQRTPTTTIFVVDASGSAAARRLAEAKGAVELLLADCYVRRDEVALIAFRGSSAELLLPPTRSLVRARRCLAGLPGGGGTPLASAIDAAVALADGVTRRGASASVVLLTDGRANIARDGGPGRPRANADALAAAKAFRAANLPALLVDTSALPEPAARTVAETMGAAYLPLPHADAATLSGAVRAARAA